MTSTTILWLYLALLILELAGGLFLTLLNYRSVRAHEGAVPEVFRGRVTPEEHAKASAYSLAKMRLGFLEEPVSAALVAAAVVLGIFGGLDALARSVSPSSLVQGVFFLGVLALGSSLLFSPFSLYATFVLEKRFGFNTTKIGTWLLDAAKGALLGAVVGLPLLSGIYLFMDVSGALWWLWAAILYSVFSLGLTILYPLLIAPLFNKFTPLPEGELATRIEELATRLGFKTRGIFVMDGSKRSRHSNAYFTGFGAAKRIVLYDTLVSAMGTEELLAVLAHEIGHEKKGHIVKMEAVSVILTFVGFYALSLLAGWKEVYAGFGFAGASRHALLLVFALLSGPLGFFLAPLFSAWSRRHEYEADDYAVRATGAGTGRGALGRALLVLNRENASNLVPHPLYSAWHYSHPTLAERLASIERTEAAIVTNEGGAARSGPTPQSRTK